jgi:hypothetical protein
MVSEEKAIFLFAKLLPNWLIYGVESIGLSCGILSSWNLRKDDFYAYASSAGILLEGIVKYLYQILKMLNCYGPYSKIEWRHVGKSGGENDRVYPLQIYFS